jgi:hypothetical protein
MRFGFDKSNIVQFSREEERSLDMIVREEAPLKAVDFIST